MYIVYEAELLLCAVRVRIINNNALKVMFHRVRGFTAISLAASLGVLIETMSTLERTTSFASRLCQSHSSHKKDATESNLGEVLPFTANT